MERRSDQQAGVENGAEGRAEAAKAPATCPVRSPWVRRLGAAAFLFFLIKGLLWLIVPALAVWWGTR